MSTGFHINDIATAKINYNGVIKSATAMWLNGQQIWPSTYSYVILLYYVEYTESSIYPGETLTYIAAKGDNHATIKGTVAKYRGSVLIETMTNVVLTPINSSQSADFYISNKNICAYDLTYNIKSYNAVTFSAKYVDENEIESPVISNITIAQQGNQIISTVDTITKMEVGTGFAGKVSVYRENSILSATKVFTRTTTYTSRYQHNDYGQTSDISDSTTFYIIPALSGASIYGRNIYVNSRVHNELEGSWQIQGEYTESGTTYTSITDLKQTPDEILSSTITDHDFIVNIGIQSETDIIDATGGRCIINRGGRYSRNMYRTWKYGEPTSDTIHPEIPSGDITLSVNNNYFHVDGATITHDNMDKRSTDDVIIRGSYYVDGEEKAHDTIIKTVNNEFHQYRDQTVEIHAKTPAIVTSSGATIDIYATRFYDTGGGYFDSGTTINPTRTSATVRPTRITLTDSPVPTWLTVPINNFQLNNFQFIVDSNPNNNPRRSANFSITYETFTDNSVLTQYAGDVITNEFRCTEFFMNETSIGSSYYGEGNKKKINYTFQQKVGTTHDDITTWTQWEALIGTQVISCNNPHFMLQNYTQSKIGQNVSVQQNDEIFIYPVSANNTTSDITTRIIPSVDSATYYVDFTHLGRYLTSISWGSNSINGNKGTNSSQQTVTATYSDGTTLPVTSSCSFSSSNTSVATVYNGIITFVEYGSATITASYTEDGITKTATLTASTNDYVTSVTLNKHSQPINAGESFGLIATVVLYSGLTVSSQDVTWSKTNNKVSINPTTGLNIIVQGISDGSVTVTASCSVGRSSALTDSCIVTVIGGSKSLNFIRFEDLTYDAIPNVWTMTKVWAYYDDGTSEKVNSSNDCLFVVSQNINNYVSLTDKGDIKSLLPEGYATLEGTITATYSYNGVTKTATAKVYVLSS